jgi:CRP/FNR family transcriptional regulator, cyclic AMP receptor protein
LVSDPWHSPDEHLASVELFSSLSRRRLKKIAELSRVVEHEPGKKVAAEGLGALAFHLVLDGRAVVQKGGRTVRTLGHGDYFGEMSMIDGKPRSADVIADGPLTTLVVPHQPFMGLLDSEPGFSKELLLVLCARLREADARLDSTA